MANNIKKIRKSKGVKQRHLAQAIEIDQSTLWRYEENKTTPKIDILLKIATFLEVEILALYS